MKGYYHFDARGRKRRQNGGRVTRNTIFN